MKFKKLVKATDNLDETEEQFRLKNNATHDFYAKLEGVAAYYARLGLSKEEIMQALTESVTRFEEDEDMWYDLGL